MAENTAQDITKQLWDMANELRGTMDASEFRNYILGFMFYRYLSEHQEKYLSDSQIVVPTGEQSFNNAYAQAANGKDLPDYLEDIASHLGYAIEPDFTWASVVEKVHTGTIKPSDYREMFERFNKNAQINPNATADFRGIFADMNLGNSRLGASTSDRSRNLGRVVEMIDKFNYKDESGHDILGDVYEYLIAEFAGNSGKKAGEFYTPHPVSKVLAKLVTYKASHEGKFSVYDPTMGSGSLLLTVRDELVDGYKMGRVQFFGQEWNTTTFNLARMNLMMHGVEYQNMTLRNANTLEDDWPSDDVNGIMHPRMFDAVVANPPYSAKWENDSDKLKDPRFKDYGKLPPKNTADYAFVLHSLYHLNNHGTMAIVLPGGVLFRSTGGEGVIRKNLIQKNKIDAVIALPGRMFYSTDIETVVVVFKKNRENKDILFVDASKDFEKNGNRNQLTDKNIDKILGAYVSRSDIGKYAHLASYDEIEDNDFNLSVSRYVDTFEEEPPVDAVQLLQDMKQLEGEEHKLRTEITDEMRQLVGIDSESKDYLDILKQVLK